MKIINLASKILAIFSIFVAPCIIILNRYTPNHTVEMQTSIGILPTIFIGLIVLVALWFTSSQLAEMIRQSKFGWLSIIFFGLTLGILLFGAWFMFNTIIISVQASVNDYVTTMLYHRQTVYYMIYPIVFGISLAGITKFIQWKIIK